MGRDIFGAAAHIRSDHRADRTWGRRGETLAVEATGVRHGMSLISAITSRGHTRASVEQAPPRDPVAWQVQDRARAAFHFSAVNSRRPRRALSFTIKQIESAAS